MSDQPLHLRTSSERLASAGALLLATLLSSCGPALRTAWVDPRVLTRAPLDPDAPAEILYERQQTALDLGPSGGESTRLVHRVIRVQHEAGRGAAAQRIVWRPDSSIVDFRARVLQPGGREEALPEALVVSDTSAEGERDLNTRVFQFPNVTEGSVLEFAFVLQLHSTWAWDERELFPQYPVHESSVSVSAAPEFVLAAAEYNGNEPIHVQSDAEGWHHLETTLLRSPRLPDEDFAPHSSLVQPRWAWRVTGLNFGKQGVKWYERWDDIAHVLVRHVAFESEHTAGLSLPVDVSGCADVRCRVERVLAVVRARTHSGDGAFEARPLARVVESGSAGLLERASLTRTLLEQVGVTAQLAFTTDLAGRQTTQDFPNVEQFDHVVTVVPPQAGLARALVVDPDCDFCAVGQLTRRHRGAPALVVTTSGGVVGRGETSTSWWPLEGEAAPRSVTRTTHRLDVAADGSAIDTLHFSWEGLAAQSLQRALRAGNADGRRRELRGLVRDALPQARTGPVGFGDCLEGAVRCGADLVATASSLGVPEGQRLYLPLHLLLPRYEGALSASPRRLPVAFGWDDTTDEEVLEVTVPEGYRLVSGPAPVSVGGDALAVRVEVEATAHGARLVRRLDRQLGLWPASRAGELRAQFRRFSDARQGVLVFERTAPAR